MSRVLKGRMILQKEQYEPLWETCRPTELLLVADLKKLK